MCKVRVESFFWCEENIIYQSDRQAVTELKLLNARAGLPGFKSWLHRLLTL